jgi:hypothetical protein
VIVDTESIVVTEVIVDAKVRKLDGWIKLAVCDDIRIYRRIVDRAQSGDEVLTEAWCYTTRALSKLRSWIQCRRRKRARGRPTNAGQFCEIGRRMRVEEGDQSINVEWIRMLTRSMNSANLYRKLRRAVGCLTLLV